MTVVGKRGIDIDHLSEAQQQALRSLNQSEVAALAAIRKNLNDNLPEVAAFAAGGGDPVGLFIW